MSPRIRYLKPEFFEDEHLAELPFEARLFFAGLWNFADKAGRLEDRPNRLKIKIFPYDKVDVEKCLDLLSKPKNGTNRPFIQRYKVGEESYIQITTWEKHQKPHHTEQESNFPPAPPLNTKGMEKGMEKISIMGSVEQASAPTNNGETTVKNLCISIINDLNDVLKTNYRITTKITKGLIESRLKEGFTSEDFKTVHRNMAQRWGPDTKMREFLRPITLYSNKFESYLNIKQESTSIVSDKTLKSAIALQSWASKGEK